MWILTTISGQVGLLMATVVFASTVFLVAMIDRTGRFVLAPERGAPISPVGLSGTRNVVLQGSWWFHTAHVGIVLGDPITTECLKRDDRD